MILCDIENYCVDKEEMVMERFGKIGCVVMVGLIFISYSHQAKAIESDTVNATKVYRISIRPGSIAAAIAQVCLDGSLFVVSLKNGGITQVINGNGNATRCK